ncbi:hypothetical protein NE237_019890 [Protea cynaroides]|uniref:Bidirectional sugar transporter SWEET n=1 Tax=Protea cynaroides TaxID=273540 RepID=A0A9Q0H8D8_9MAGN|nr:hypothetical protein NE237_019890 [Protea cynaroides]
MGMLTVGSNPWVFTFGLLGNIVSFLVLLAPTPTFVRVCKKKSTEGFHSLPYLAAVFSAMLWIYYAFLKTGANYLITINSIGCVIETVYIVIYLVYAPRKARILTAKLLLLMNFGGFCMILLLSQLLFKGPKRVQIVGGFSVAFSVCVFVAPLSILKRVMVTKSVEFMPFTLSFFLTLSAVMWFCYGFLLKDYYIALPNILGFIFGVLQMVLYVVYKGCCDKKVKAVREEQKIQDQIIIDIVRSSTIRGWEVHPVDPNAVIEEGMEEDDQDHRNINLRNVGDEEQKTDVDDDGDAENNPTREDSGETHGTHK